jgi:hypothetical protein
MGRARGDESGIAVIVEEEGFEGVGRGGGGIEGTGVDEETGGVRAAGRFRDCESEHRKSAQIYLRRLTRQQNSQLGLSSP